MGPGEDPDTGVSLFSWLCVVVGAKSWSTERVLRLAAPGRPASNCLLTIEWNGIDVRTTFRRTIAAMPASSHLYIIITCHSFIKAVDAFDVVSR
jgi:hypothetical protein